MPCKPSGARWTRWPRSRPMNAASPGLKPLSSGHMLPRRLRDQPAVVEGVDFRPEPGGEAVDGVLHVGRGAADKTADRRPVQHLRRVVLHAAAGRVADDVPAAE